jgi:hypothetical protein
VLVAAVQGANAGSAKSFRGGFRVPKAVCLIEFVFDSAFGAIELMVKRTHSCLSSTSVFCLEKDSRRYILGAILKEDSAIFLSYY